MKKKEIVKGIRVFRRANCWDGPDKEMVNGVIIGEPFADGNDRRPMWRVPVRMNDGHTYNTPIHQLIKKDEEE